MARGGWLLLHITSSLLVIAPLVVALVTKEWFIALSHTNSFKLGLTADCSEYGCIPISYRRLADYSAGVCNRAESEVEARIVATRALVIVAIAFAALQAVFGAAAWATNAFRVWVYAVHISLSLVSFLCTLVVVLLFGLTVESWLFCGHTYCEFIAAEGQSCASYVGYSYVLLGCGACILLVALVALLVSMCLRTDYSSVTTTRTVITQRHQLTKGTAMQKKMSRGAYGVSPSAASAGGSPLPSPSSGRQRQTASFNEWGAPYAFRNHNTKNNGGNPFGGSRSPSVASTAYAYHGGDMYHYGSGRPHAAEADPFSPIGHSPQAATTSNRQQQQTPLPSPSYVYGAAAPPTQRSASASFVYQRRPSSPNVREAAAVGYHYAPHLADAPQPQQSLSPNRNRNPGGFSRASSADPYALRAVPPTAAAVAPSSEEEDEEGVPSLPPELSGGDWAYEADNGYFWSEAEQLYFEPSTQQFYDPEQDAWYDGETGEWVPAGDGEEGEALDDAAAVEQHRFGDEGWVEESESAPF